MSEAPDQEPENVEEPVEVELVDEPAREPDASERIAELESKLARARADYDNLQKRNAREAALERDRVKARVLEHFLPVHEYARLALVEAEKNPGPLAQGVTMLVREFDRMLEAEGVGRIEGKGEPFDSSCQEAIAQQESEAPKDEVIEVVAPGYRLGDRVLRYAKVVVSKGP